MIKIRASNIHFNKNKKKIMSNLNQIELLDS